jgi:tetratricopeptide (TPR) repeat protein
MLKLAQPRQLRSCSVCRALTLACIVIGSTAAPDALAQPNVDHAAPAATAEQEKAVKTLVAAGVTAYRRKDFEGAREAFEKAWATFPYASVAASLADVEMKLGRYTAAAEHWEYYLANIPPDPDEAKAQLDECRKHAARVQLRVTPADAEVLLDGSRVEITSGARTLWLEPGQHALFARSGDRTSLTRTITLSPGHDEDVRLDVPAPEPIATAVQPAYATAPPVVPRREPPPRADNNTARNVVVITGSALTLGSLLVGVVSTLRHSSEMDARDATFGELRAEVPSSYGDDSVCVPRADLPAKCAELHQHLVHADAAQNLATGGFVSAGVFGAATVATYLLWPRARERPARANLSFAPLTIDRARGAQVRWLF